MFGVTFYSIVGVVALFISILLRKEVPEALDNREGIKLANISTQISIVAVMQQSNKNKKDGE